jgi:hypothetical protein
LGPAGYRETALAGSFAEQSQARVTSWWTSFAVLVTQLARCPSPPCKPPGWGWQLVHSRLLRVASCGIFRPTLSAICTSMSHLGIVLSTDEPLTCSPGGFGVGSVSGEQAAARAIRARGRVGEDDGGACDCESTLCDDDGVQFQLGYLRQIVGQAR